MIIGGDATRRVTATRSAGRTGSGDRREPGARRPASEKRASAAGETTGARTDRWRQHRDDLPPAEIVLEAPARAAAAARAFASGNGYLIGLLVDRTA